jgi:chromosomal replication initiation ATPase DnaA
VDTVLAKAKERRSHQKELRRRGYDLKRVADRVARVLGSDVKQIYAVGRQQDKVKARDLYCFWAVRELGVSLTDLARRLGMSPPGVGYAVRRGEAIAQKKRYRLAA